MSDLLSIGLSGVTAYQSALSAVGDNVANAQTPGYARRTVTLEEMNSGGKRDFSGVEATSVTRAWDAYRAADSRYAASAAGRADVRQQWLSSVETTLDDGAAGVGQLMGGFFDAAESLAASPSDPQGRSAMLTALDSAASAIRGTADGLARVSNGITQAVQTDVDGLNADMGALVEINRSLQQTTPGLASRAAMEDERDRILDSIAARIDVNASIGADGTATLTLGSATSVTLLDPTSRAVVSAAVAADGRIQLRMFANGTTSPLPATGGRLAGLVDVAGTTADKRTAFEAMAQKFTTDVNNWSAQGIDANDNPGGPLLSMTAGAVSLTALATDPAVIAAASTDGTENGNLLELSALRGPTGAEAGWAALVSANAQALSSAKSEASATATRRDTSFAARDEISGIDLDTEAAELLRYQRAYDSSAKIIQVARDTVQSILNLFGN